MGTTDVMFASSVYRVLSETECVRTDYRRVPCRVPRADCVARGCGVRSGSRRVAGASRYRRDATATTYVPVPRPSLKSQLSSPHTLLITHSQLHKSQMQNQKHNKHALSVRTIPFAPAILIASPESSLAPSWTPATPNYHCAPLLSVTSVSPNRIRGVPPTMAHGHFVASWE